MREGVIESRCATVWSPCQRPQTAFGCYVLASKHAARRQTITHTLTHCDTQNGWLSKEKLCATHIAVEVRYRHHRRLKTHLQAPVPSSSPSLPSTLWLAPRTVSQEPFHAPVQDPAQLQVVKACVNFSPNFAWRMRSWPCAHETLAGHQLCIKQHPHTTDTFMADGFSDKCARTLMAFVRNTQCRCSSVRSRRVPAAQALQHDVCAHCSTSNHRGGVAQSFAACIDRSSRHHAGSRDRRQRQAGPDGGFHQ